MAALQFPGSRKDLVVGDSGRYNRCTGVWGAGVGKGGRVCMCAHAGWK